VADLARSPLLSAKVGFQPVSFVYFDN